MIAEGLNSFIYGKKEIYYELLFRRRKTLGIKVFPEGFVKVYAPEDLSVDKIEEKLKEKARWILKHQREFFSYRPLTPARKFINGETHLYLGRQYVLSASIGEKNEVKVFRGKLLVSHRENTTVEMLLRKWYRAKATELFSVLLREKIPAFANFNLQAPALVVREMNKRWGSCTAKWKIILNPELIKAPKGSIEYVMIHELCHLVHHNHTKDFYNLQQKMMPDWMKWKNKLEYTLV